METEWVDFRIIKAAVTMQMVLDRYGLTLKKSGQELRGKCPIHRGSNNKHFTANVTKNVFKCFFAQCGAHGNVLDFVALMEQCSVRDAALKLNVWFSVGDSVEQSDAELDQKIDEAVVVRKGIYSDKEGRLYEVTACASSAEDLEPCIIYRELFGDYQFWVGPVSAFLPDQAESKIGECRFSLIRELQS